MPQPDPELAEIIAQMQARLADQAARLADKDQLLVRKDQALALAEVKIKVWKSAFAWIASPATASAARR